MTCCDVCSTNQFSVTEHFRRIGAKEGQGLPGARCLLVWLALTHASRAGVFVFYELSPIMVRFTETRESFSHFLTQLCAILGGVFTVAGIIDRIIYSGLRHL